MQHIDWAIYNNTAPYFSSEKEFIIGALLSRQNPDLALELPTLKDVFMLKSEGNHLETRAQKELFLKAIYDQLHNLPYISAQLNTIEDYLSKKRKLQSFQ